MEWLVAQISAAEKEARKDEWDTKIKTWSNPFKVREQAYREGRASMREEAAKVADEVWEEHKNDGPSAEHMAETIIDQIRKIGVEGK